MKQILVVVDMQNDFVDGALGSKESAEIVDNCTAKIKNFKGEIIVTMDTHEETYLNTREGKYLPVTHCVKGTKGWQLNEKIKNVLDDKRYIVLEKNTFGSMDIIEKIAEITRSEERFVVEVIGLVTDICVLSNALLIKAAFPEADIRLDSSCCAGVTPLKHKAALEVMSSCQIEVY